MCEAARALGRVLRPGGRALIASVPKETCAVTQDADWDCPRCFWKLKVQLPPLTSPLPQPLASPVCRAPSPRPCDAPQAVDKDFWHRCFKGGSEGIRVQIMSNTELFPSKPAAYCHREHYSVMPHAPNPTARPQRQPEP